MKSLLFILVFAGCSFSYTSFGQSKTVKSRVAMASIGSQTKIWVSDFPKQTSIVVTDSDNNILSKLSTNDYGAAYIIVEAPIKTGVIVKTLDGEVIVSNKAVLSNNKHEEQTASRKNAENVNKV